MTKPNRVSINFFKKYKCVEILAIYGSPRKEGNTARMLDAALSVFPENAEIERIYLGELNFSGCGP